MTIVIERAKKHQLNSIQIIARRTIKACYKSFLGDEAVEAYVLSGESDREIMKYLEQTDVMEENEQIYGFCIYFDDFIHLMMIDEVHQRNGLGSALLEHAEKMLFKNNQTIRLETFEGNIPALKFYEKQGWKKVEKEQKDDGPKRVYLEKSKA